MGRENHRINIMVLVVELMKPVEDVGTASSSVNKWETTVKPQLNVVSLSTFVSVLWSPAASQEPGGATGRPSLAHCNSTASISMTTQPL